MEPEWEGATWSDVGGLCYDLGKTKIVEVFMFLFLAVLALFSGDDALDHLVAQLAAPYKARPDVETVQLTYFVETEIYGTRSSESSVQIFDMKEPRWVITSVDSQVSSGFDGHQSWREPANLEVTQSKQSALREWASTLPVMLTHSSVQYRAGPQDAFYQTVTFWLEGDEKPLATLYVHPKTHAIDRIARDGDPTKMYLLKDWKTTNGWPFAQETTYESGSIRMRFVHEETLFNIKNADALLTAR